MSAHTMGVSTIDYNGTGSTLNTTGLLFKLYGDRFVGSVPVAISGNSPEPAPKYPAGGDQPKTNSGSPTYPLDMVAALSADRKFLTLGVVNATSSEQKFDLSVAGARLSGPSTVWRMMGKDLDAANRVGEPPQVAITETPVASASGAISVAPISIDVYRFSLSQTQ
jgi:alpha-N-arabinofuranosidase